MRVSVLFGIPVTLCRSCGLAARISWRWPSTCSPRVSDWIG
jgi:hypothetical protein